MDIACVIAAFLFFLSAVLGVMELRQLHDHPEFFDPYMTKQFNADYIQQGWVWRAEIRPLATSTGLVNAVAWLSLCIPIVHAAWVSSRGGRSKVGIHVAIVLLAVAGSITELLSRAMAVGAFNVTEWLASDFKLYHWLQVDQTNDEIGWKVLELVSLVLINGMMIWVDALEFLFLGAIFFLFFAGIWMQDQPLLGRCWSSLGLLLSIVSLVDFAADILRFQDWKTFAPLAFFITSVSQVVLFPLWIVWLGCILPTAERKLREQEGNLMKVAGLAGPSSQSAGGEEVTSAFT